jgi:transcriptional regulator with XRE-family HTH domain
MQIHKKLKIMRQCKNWTQEELAEKLGWAVNSYAKVERGETDIKFDKLKKISDVMGIDLSELVDSDQKTILNFAENCTYTNSQHAHIILSETQCAHELEKAQLLLNERDKEIIRIKHENKRLQELFDLFKTEKT